MGNLNLNNERVQSLLNYDKEMLVELFLTTSLLKRKAELESEREDLEWRSKNEDVTEKEYDEEIAYYKEALESLRELGKQYFID